MRGLARPKAFSNGGKVSPMPKKGLASDQIFRKYQNCQELRFPVLAGHTDPALVAGFVFLGLELLHESRRGVAPLISKVALSGESRPERHGILSGYGGVGLSGKFFTLFYPFGARRSVLGRNRLVR